MASVVFINCFEVPSERDDEFLRLWREVNAYMRAKPGYRSHKLHRAISADNHFRFVNVAEWESAELLAAAHDDGFRRFLANPAWNEFRSKPGPFEVVHESRVEELSPVTATKP